MKRHHPVGAGFTLVELLTVVAIVGVLAGILIPVVSRVRDSARTSRCLSNMKENGVAILLYAADNRGRLPVTSQGVESAGWVFYQNKIWPYLLDWGSQVYACPKDEIDLPSRQFEWSYGMPQSIRPGDTVVSLSASSPGGPSHRALLLESNTWAAAINYPGPVLASATPPYIGKIRDAHGGKTNVLYLDGHVAATRVRELTLWQIWPGFGSDTPLPGP